MGAFQSTCRRYGRPVVLSIVCAAVSTTVALADSWYDFYDRGETALRQKHWEDAVRELSQAIKQKGDPGINVRTYGTNFIDYTPYLKLGEAYLELGNPDAALQALATEEQLGAIAKSKASMAELAQVRSRAQAAQAQAVAKARESAATRIADAIAESKDLEQKGRIDEALTAVARAIALDPKDPQALAAQQRLRDRLAAAEQAKSSDQQFARLVEEGKGHLAAGRLQGASSSFSQALAIKKNAEVESLLQTSQNRLREQVTANKNAESRRTLVSDAVAAAAKLEASGRIAEALSKLQEALAVEPGDASALAARGRLAKSQADAESAAAAQDTIGKLLQEGNALLDAGKLDDALRSFNRILAIDPKNAGALASVANAYSGINRSLLGRPQGPKLPPAIRFLDEYNAKDDHGELRAVEMPNFQLSGMIVSQHPAELSVLSPQGEPAGTIAVVDSKVAELHVGTFKKDLALLAGLNTITISAKETDAGSQDAATYTYRVRYDRPWTRSPWLYAGLGLAAVGGGVGLVLQRNRRRNRLLTRRFNPFVAGAPVMTDDLFLGRELLVSRILQSIHNNSILLYGERRIGKTSLQHHLKRRLKQMQDPEFAFFPVYIDLQGTPEDRFFKTLGDDVFEDLEPVLKGRVPRTPLAEGEAYGYTHLVRELRAVLAVLKASTPKRVKVVLLIDEVDELNAYDPRVNQKLRSLFMKSFAEDLAAVVSGVGIKKHWESEGSPWYNFFEEIEVKPFSRKDAEELIQRPIRGVMQLEPGVVDAIVEKTGCRPYLIQKVCIVLVNHAHDQRRRLIKKADVDLVRPTVEG